MLKNVPKHPGISFSHSREIAIMKYLMEMDTPNVVPLVDVTRDTITEKVSVMMPHYSGSLADRCLESQENCHALTPAEIRAFSRQLLTGIRHCHAAGIAQRDKKAGEHLDPQSRTQAEAVLLIGDLGMGRFVSRTDHFFSDNVLTVTLRCARGVIPVQ